MATVAEQLSDINMIKIGIRDAIITKGVHVDSSAPFHSYIDGILSIDSHSDKGFVGEDTAQIIYIKAFESDARGEASFINTASNYDVTDNVVTEYK